MRLAASFVQRVKLLPLPEHSSATKRAVISAVEWKDLNEKYT